MKSCFFLFFLAWNILAIDARSKATLNPCNPPPARSPPSARSPPHSPPPSLPHLGSFTIDGARHASIAPGAAALKKRSVPHPPIANGSRVAYGQSARPGQFPFATYVTDYMYACSGSLIAPRVVLTAAHCVTNDTTGAFSDLPNFVFTVGSVDSTVNPTNYLMSATVPEAWGQSNLYGDLAVVELDSASPFTPVHLATPATSLAKVPDTTVVGWGLTQSQNIPNILQYASMSTIPNLAQCEKLHEQYLHFPLPADHMCMGLGKSSTSACQGDSGGPYLIPGSPPVQVALTSYAPSSYTCGDKTGNFQVPTSLIYWSTWIQDVLSLYNLNGKTRPARLNTVVQSACFQSTNYKILTTATVGQCCEACRADTKCKAWTWTLSNHHCELKTASGAHASNRICTSGTMA